MKLVHPNTKKTIEVREDQADLYATQGWKPSAAKAAKAPVKKAAPEPK